MKNKTILLMLVFGFFLLFGLNVNGYAGPAAPGEAGGEESGVEFTWPDLQKLLDLKSDKIKLTWKEFQTLLEQSGNRVDMNFQIADGIVTIKRDRFRQILNRMTPPKGTSRVAPPTDHLVTEAKYTGTVEKNICRFTVRFRVFVFERDALRYIRIPLLSARHAVSGITVNGSPGSMHIHGGWYTINLKESGYHDVNATFSAARNKQAVSFPVVRSVINSVDFTVPFKDYEINIASALNTGSSASVGSSAPSTGSSTRLTANLPPMNRMSVNWNPKSKKRVKKPALFYASTHSLVSAAADILKVQTTIDLEVLQSSLDTISLKVPKKDEVVRVSGRSIKDWQVRETDIGRVLEIHFGFDISDRFRFAVQTERMLAADTLGVDFKGLQVLDARRETGAIGIVAGSAVEVDVQPGPELEKLEFHQLPKRILDMSSRPVLYSYKYSGHPWRLGIAIHKHEQLKGISTVIESAVGTALVLREGKMLYKLVYTVRNSYKQFMELELPENAGIWTVIVDNKREKASRNKDGKVLVPLVRSSGNGDRLKSFRVQLIYTQPIEAFQVRGSSQYYFPKTDIFINKIRMELYLPEGYSYDFDKGEWKEVLAAPKSYATVKRQNKGNKGRLDSKKDLRASGELAATTEEKVARRKKEAEKETGGFEDADKFKRLEEDEAAGQDAGAKKPASGKRETKKVKLAEVKQQLGASLTGPAGLSSISVRLPVSGIKYAFSKTIVDKDETYPLTFSYIHSQTQTFIYISLGAVLLLLLVFFIVKRLRRRSLIG